MKKQKMKLKDKVQFSIIIGIFAVIVSACVISILHNDMTASAEDNFRELEQQVSVTVPKVENANGVTNSKNSDTYENTSYSTGHNVSSLEKKNNECIGWLTVNDTGISYPVMQSTTDHQKYLNRDFNGNYSLSGTPFLDYRCSLKSANMIIYGHHMNDGSMFGTLMNYTRKSYRDSHPTITFEIKDGVRKYTVFSVMKTNSNDTWYKFIEAKSAEKFCKRIAYAKENSLYTTGITPSASHKLLSLSTCTNESEEERLIVIAYEN